LKLAAKVFKFDPGYWLLNEFNSYFLKRILY
jgi:hypothetical protein